MCGVGFISNYESKTYHLHYITCGEVCIFAYFFLSFFTLNNNIQSLFGILFFFVFFYKHVSLDLFGKIFHRKVSFFRHWLTFK